MSDWSNTSLRLESKQNITLPNLTIRYNTLQKAMQRCTFPIIEINVHTKNNSVCVTNMSYSIESIDRMAGFRGYKYTIYILRDYLIFNYTIQ